MMALPEGFSIIKQPIGFHSPMKREVPGFTYGEPARASSTARSTAVRSPKRACATSSTASPR